APSSSTSTEVTAAAGGPSWQRISISVTPWAQPENRASTEPSRQLRTQPVRASADAVSWVQKRKLTPCTRPAMRTRTVRVWPSSLMRASIMWFRSIPERQPVLARIGSAGQHAAGGVDAHDLGAAPGHAPHAQAMAELPQACDHRLRHRLLDQHRVAV